MRWLACTIAVAQILSLAACSTYSRSDAERYITDSEKQWAESVAANDPSVLRRILADDFVWVLPDGSIWTKSHAIADAAAGPGDFVSDHVDYVHIRFFGNTAVAQGSETWERKRGAHVRTGRFVWSDTWVYRDGQWKIEQAEDLTAPRILPDAGIPH